MANHLLEVKDLHTSFNIPSGEVRSVNGISFTLDKNEVLGIVGESGSGKSVTAYSIMQILEKPGRVVGGSIKFQGKEMLNIPHNQIQNIRGSKVSIIFQDSMTSLNPVWSIGNQLKECIRVHPDIPAYNKLKVRVEQAKENIQKAKGNASKEEIKKLQKELADAKKEYKEYPHKRCLEMLQLVGINEPEKRLKQYPFEFSGGMLQRVMIAMALICEPELIIADEPTTALDVTIQAQILELLISIQKKMGMGIIIITHDLGVVAQICDRVNVMYAGRIVETGTVREIFYNPKHEYTKGLINSIPKMEKRTGEKLKPIPGNPVDVFRLPDGCSFVPRCDKCMKVCLKKYPKYLEVSETHKTACFAYAQEMLEQGLMTEEQFQKYLDSSESGNKAYKSIDVYDINKARIAKIENADEAKVAKKEFQEKAIDLEQLQVAKYHASESKFAYKRVKTDFKLSLKNHLQSRGEKKSIDRNDVGKKVAHVKKEVSALAGNMSGEEFNKYLENLVIYTTAVNENITENDVKNAQLEFKGAKKEYNEVKAEVRAAEKEILDKEAEVYRNAVNEFKTANKEYKDNKDKDCAEEKDAFAKEAKKKMLEAKANYKKAKEIFRAYKFKDSLLALEDKVYKTKFKYFDSVDALEWKNFVYKKKYNCSKRLRKIYINSKVKSLKKNIQLNVAEMSDKEFNALLDNVVNSFNVAKYSNVKAADVNKLKEEFVKARNDKESIDFEEKKFNYKDASYKFNFSNFVDEKAVKATKALRETYLKALVKVAKESAKKDISEKEFKALLDNLAKNVNGTIVKPVKELVLKNCEEKYSKAKKGNFKNFFKRDLIKKEQYVNAKVEYMRLDNDAKWKSIAEFKVADAITKMKNSFDAAKQKGANQDVK